MILSFQNNLITWQRKIFGEIIKSFTGKGKGNLVLGSRCPIFFPIISITVLFACSERNPVDVFEVNSPAVVSIQVYDVDNELVGSGSGVIVSDSGIILTNYHVLEIGDKLEIISSSKKTYPVTGVIAADKNIDYALLKIASSGTPKIKIGDSGKAKVGGKIFTISSPASALYQNTFASGEISGIRQRELLPTGQQIESVLGRQLIQISAPISSGSSGGALLNEDGELIGLLVAQSTEGNNLNFAIPINEIKGAFTSQSFLTFATFKKLSSTEKAKEQPEQANTSTKSVYSGLDPKYSFKDMVRLGNQAFEKEDYDGAILAWLGALKKQPKSVVVMNKLAYALVRLNQFDKALEIYGKALAINPEHYLTIFNLGELSHQMYLTGCLKCKDEAIGLYSHSLELHPPSHVEKQAIERILSLKSQ